MQPLSKHNVLHYDNTVSNDSPQSATDVAHLPLAFLDALSQARTLDDVLSCTSYWVMQIFQADRASIALQYDNNYLKLYSLTGNDVIPVDSLIPIQGTFVGSVFSQRELAICTDNRTPNLLDCQMLAKGGLLSCVDVPLVSEGHCYGTLNLAHHRIGAYSRHDARILVSLANWVAAQIRSKKQLQELELLATIDPLTGVLNRRAFVEATQHTGSKPRSHDHQLALLMIDLDAFKSINDRYGHLAGDEVLSTVARELEKNIRAEDICARFGGEEFAVLLRNVEPGEALTIADSLRQHIEQLRVTYNHSVIRVSASIGLTTPHQKDTCFNDMIHRADNALYRAKEQGRNRVIFQARSVKQPPNPPISPN